MIQEILCLLTHGKHQFTTVFDGPRRYEVCLCGYRTPGITLGESPVHVFGTRPYWDAVYEEMLEMELSLHWGG